MDEVEKELKKHECAINYADNSNTNSTIQTPFILLNQFLEGGFHPGQFIIFDARPAIGKTALALDIASHVGRTVSSHVQNANPKEANDETEKIVELILRAVINADTRPLSLVQDV